MKLAFCLFKFFPYGGLQRDFLRIAKACHARGHEIHVFTMHWEGAQEPDFHLHVLKVKGKQNHTRNRNFAKCVQQELQRQAFDLVIGFNKMPFLDLYYAADICYQARIREQRSFWHRLLPRYRQLKSLEESIFARGKQTEIMLISSLQRPEFIRCYQTEAERFHLLPPGIAKDRIAPANAAEIRTQTRHANQINEQDFMLLLVGSGFKTKGLDRIISGLASLPDDLKQRTQLFVIGQDDAKPFAKLARELHVANRVHFLGGRPDVPNFLLAADLLVHPAYHENTGTVLLEALVAGLPVLTVDNCGYAHYVSDTNAGMVLTSPFQQAAFNASLEKMLRSSERAEWQKNGLAFANNPEIYSLPERSADIIENIGRKRATLSA